FAVIDTEADRARHYAPRSGDEPDFKHTFRFRHVSLGAPFRPDAYEGAIVAAERAGYRAIVVDSFSHEHDGEGGHLGWAEEILRESVEPAMKRQGERRAERDLR